MDILNAPRALSHGRILVVTSRKIGNAVKRNRVRRRIKALFYERNLFLSPFDWVVIVKKGGVDLSFKDLETILVSHMNAEHIK